MTLKLVSWNVNGLRSVMRKGFGDFVKQQQPDIICLQEVKLSDELVLKEEKHLQDYQVFYSLAEKKGYSGVATLVRNELLGSRDKVQHKIGISRFDREGRFLILIRPDFVLYNIYFPSGTTGDERQKFKYCFLDTLTAHFESLPKAWMKRMIVCGDFNICHREIDIHHPKEAARRELSGFLPREREWLDRFIDRWFSDSFRQIKGDVAERYSWWSYRAGSRKKNLGWRIDYILAGSGLRSKIVDADILDSVHGSDHCPIFMRLSA